MTILLPINASDRFPGKAVTPNYVLSLHKIVFYEVKLQTNQLIVYDCIIGKILSRVCGLNHKAKLF